MQPLVIAGVSKAFQGPQEPLQALSALSTTIPPGKVVGLLGPNGSGKTTLLRLIMGLTLPDTGEIRYGPQPMAPAIRRHFGYMPEERGLYPRMTARSQLRYLLQLKGLARAQAEAEIQRWAEKLEAPWLDRPARTLSKGMQQKVQLILALAGQPWGLLLDEPFSGLDPLVTAEIETLLQEEARKGLLILLSTHRLEQVDLLCEHVLLIHKGVLRLAGEVAALRKTYWDHTYEIETALPIAEVAWPEGLTWHATSAHRAALQLPPDQSPRPFLEAILRQTDIRFFAEKLPTLKDIFLKVTETV